MNNAMRRELTAVLEAPCTDDGVRVVLRPAPNRAFSAGRTSAVVGPLVPTGRKRIDFRQEMDRARSRSWPPAATASAAGSSWRWRATSASPPTTPRPDESTRDHPRRAPSGSRLIGRGKALEMILTGARIPAAEALAIGLVERVVPAADLLVEAGTLVRTMADKAPVALRYAKESVVKGLELPLADGIRLEGDLSTLLRTTEDRLEGAKAFLEKRKPRWAGR
jgi:enoyl-CoA hydratase